MTDPGVGIHYGISFDEYLAWDALNHSRLWTVHRRTLAHYKWEIEHPKEIETEAMIVGRAVHAAVLEPDSFEARYAVGGPVNARTGNTYGTATKAFAEWAAEQGKPVLSTEQHDLACRLRDAVWAHKTARMLLTGAQVEVSMQWHDEQTALLCKGRPDALNKGVLIDLKTTRCANVNDFGRDSYKLGYVMQAALYYDGATSVSDTEIGEFLFIAVEKEPPHLCAVYQVEKDEMDLGRYHYRICLQQIQGAMESGKWPGYGEEIYPLVLPGYAGMELSASQF